MKDLLVQLILHRVKNIILIETGEHTSNEVYYFHKDEKIFKPKLFIKREQEYSV